MAVEFSLFLPQMRLSLPDLATRARAAEAAGFTGTALMDHLAPPMAETQPAYEAMATALYLLTHTTTLRVGHLVLCDGFRHPAVLANQVVTLDHASGGRFDLGLGWGSVPAEFTTFGIADPTPRVRVARFAETLDVLQALWTGEPVTYQGDFHRLDNALQRPTPLGPIPIVIGGSGPKTLAQVRKHADWWNLPVHQLRKLDELRDQVGDVPISIQLRATVLPGDERDAEIAATAARRFGPPGRSRFEGTADQLVEHVAALEAKGVRRIYLWFTDFATPETLAAVGETVIPQFA